MAAIEQKNVNDVTLGRDTGGYLNNSFTEQLNTTTSNPFAIGLRQTSERQGAQMQGMDPSLSKMYMQQVNDPNYRGVAQQQLQQATERNIGQAMALSAAQRGMAAGASQKGLADRTAGLNAQAAADSGLIRLQEKQQAADALYKDSQFTRGANLQSEMQQRGMNDQMRQFYLNEAGQNSRLNSQLGVQGQIANQQAALGFNQQHMDKAARDRAYNMEMFKAGAQGVGTAAALMSDERMKENIVRSSEEAYPGVPAASWTWKHDPSGEVHYGVIAQDLEAVAPQFVREICGIKHVDYSFLDR